MGEAVDDANEMVVVVVCSCYVWGGGLVCLEASVHTTYYQYVIETCRGTNNNIIIRLYHTNLDEKTVI
jgi:hypothetical protein